jgi:hypothetical protein
MDAAWGGMGAAKVRWCTVCAMENKERDGAANMWALH